MDRQKLAQALKRHKKEICFGLDHLEYLKIIIKPPKQPLRVEALSFDKALKQLLEIKKEQAKDLQKNRDSLLSSWHEITQ